MLDMFLSVNISLLGGCSVFFCCLFWVLAKFGNGGIPSRDCSWESAGITQQWKGARKKG